MTAPDPLWTSQVVDGKHSPGPDCRMFPRRCREPSPRLPSRGRGRMGAVESLRLSRCPRCQRLFAICYHCDRGHVYCGPSCSEGARRDSLRRARRRHRRSPEGRLDHRDRERERRLRRRLFRARVGDHPSATAEPEIKLVPALDPSGISTVEIPLNGSRKWRSRMLLVLFRSLRLSAWSGTRTAASAVAPAAGFAPPRPRIAGADTRPQAPESEVAS